MRGSLGLLMIGFWGVAAHALDATMPPPPPQEMTLEEYGPPDPPALERGCAEGKVRDCLYLGILYERGEPGDKVEYDHEQAQRLWKRVAELSQAACDAGDAKACGEMGRAYRLGRGVAKDMARAAGFLATACQGGEAVSCFYLAQQHARGQGVAQDEARALELYRKACEAKFPPACSAVQAAGQ